MRQRRVIFGGVGMTAAIFIIAGLAYSGAVRASTPNNSCVMWVPPLAGQAGGFYFCDHPLDLGSHVEVVQGTTGSQVFCHGTVQTVNAAGGQVLITEDSAGCPADVMNTTVNIRYDALCLQFHAGDSFLCTRTGNSSGSPITFTPGDSVELDFYTAGFCQGYVVQTAAGTARVRIGLNRNQCSYEANTEVSVSYQTAAENIPPTVASCTLQPGGDYLCAKTLTAGTHIALDQEPGICHGMVAYNPPPTAGTASVTVTEDINACPLTNGQVVSMDYFVATPANVTCTQITAASPGFSCPRTLMSGDHVALNYIAGTCHGAVQSATTDNADVTNVENISSCPVTGSSVTL
ncbi:MAG: hypothetical protein PHI63_04600, partial [Patescibacteria group bacterium]|nr:hypothetical protein [Patescibacteria group bacterium]